MNRNSEFRTKRRHAWCVFAAGVAAMAATIGAGLPSVAKWPAVKRRMETLRQQHVDGNATYYTDQTALETFDYRQLRFHD